MSEVEKGCVGCGNRCMDMDMEPYCSAVNKPWGQTLSGGRPWECGPKLALWKPDERKAHPL